MLGANLAAFVLSLPLIGLLGLIAYLFRSFSVLPIGVTVVVAILPNPAAAGLHFLAREYAHTEPVYAREQWDALRRYGVIALKAWLLSVPITAVLMLNTVFYASARFPLSGLLAVLWLYVLLTWFAAHLYVYPLIIEQEVKGILVIYRNALLMTVSRPLFSYIVLPFWLGLVLACSAVGLVAVIGLAIGAAIQQNAAARILPTFDIPTPQ
jgi:hypothetical protein